MFYPPGALPIEPLLRDPEISEIMINGPTLLYVERRGVIEKIPPVFSGPAQLDEMVESLVGESGRSVTMKSPFVDFRLMDGSRVNVVIAPIALGGTTVTIRKFSKGLDTLDEILAKGTLGKRMAALLWAAVHARLNMMFCGGAGTGKTTLLGALAGFIPNDERIVVIEDTAELQFKQLHVVRMECRPPNVEGQGGVTLGDLLRNSLRMRPNRLIVGEIRGSEAVEMLHAMSSGHDGCMAVLHASSAQQAVSRLEMMLLASQVSMPLWGIQRQIGEALDLIVHIERQPDGSRKVTQISEVSGTDSDGVRVRDLFRYDVDRRKFVCTGVQPDCYARLERVDRRRVSSLFQPG